MTDGLRVKMFGGFSVCWNGQYLIEHSARMNKPQELLALLLARADETVAYMCVTMAAMPAGANTAVFSELYTNDSASAASVISISTLLSIGTIPLMIFVTSKALEWIG